MLEVASTIIQLVGNLLDPASYLVGVVGNAEGARRMLRRRQNVSPIVDEDVVQVRIGVVGPGRVPAYRLEAVGTVGDGSDHEIIGVFDGEKHAPLRSMNGSDASTQWSDAVTPVSDIKKVLTILDRFGGAGVR